MIVGDAQVKKKRAVGLFIPYAYKLGRALTGFEQRHNTQTLNLDRSILFEHHVDRGLDGAADLDIALIVRDSTVSEP